MSELVNDSGLIAFSAAISKGMAPFMQAAEQIRKAVEAAAETMQAVAKAYERSPHYKKRKAQEAYCTVRTIPLTHKEAQSAGLAQLDERAHRRIAFQQWASPLELLANSLNAHAPPQFFDRQNYWQVAQE